MNGRANGADRRRADGAGAGSWEALVLDCPLPRLEARVLLEAASGRRREWLIAHGDEAADPAAAQAFALLVQRRRDGEPIAYLVGAREFAGRRFATTPAVLVPRPDTETLVAFALANTPAQGRVLDLGTGSGAIAITIACEREDVRIVATDRSEAALALARRNAEALCPRALETRRLQLRAGDWWRCIGHDERFDVVVSNPPYVADDDPHLREGDLRFEPRDALAAGADGLDALRAIIDGAAPHVATDGWLALEHGHEQGEAVRALLAARGWREPATRRDDAGRPRITCARPFL
ncbi:MAG: peptide chain release factor N(5)-glutamine methyltransferase [Burkholderiaceae bacterium]|nr:peptide chain release factor N(5)-glutamine methyltransferase [Burkholderiaceae bacterium]